MALPAVPLVAGASASPMGGLLTSLVKVLGPEIAAEYIVKQITGGSDGANQKNFNLEVTANSDYDCGTVACIGGWCWLLRCIVDAKQLLDSPRGRQLPSSCMSLELKGSTRD